MAFVPKTGCPLCGIVATAQHTPRNSVRSPSHPQGSNQLEVLWRDDNFTAYREKAYPVSSRGHVIIAFNLHVPSIYSLSSSDLPLLIAVRSIARRVLRVSDSYPSTSAATASASVLTLSPPLPSSPPPLDVTDTPGDPNLRVGFITGPFKDPKIPVSDHLHAHAYISPSDKAGWWRSMAYGPFSWYDIDDLIAEIRETTSNNRVKSGYQNRTNAPIDTVDDAGARSGAANGIETTEPSLATFDAEAGVLLTPGTSPNPSRPNTPGQPASPTTAATGDSTSQFLAPA